jgi:hypothetical protein
MKEPLNQILTWACIGIEHTLNDECIELSKKQRRSLKKKLRRIERLIDLLDVYEVAH